MVDTSHDTAELIAEIARWKAQRNAVILAHNYQRPEVQDIADYVGDSLELSLKAAQLPQYDVILFCSVDFMAETAKLLAPEKMVLLPDAQAGCPMADMVTPEGLRALKARHPGVPVVCYVNSSAAVKAECDITCTSANAVAVVNSLEGDTVIFAPDQCLGAWVQRHTNKSLILWDGFCPTHNRILAEHITAMRAAYPHAEVMIHPECPMELLEMGDHVVSTGGMVRVARESAATAFIVATEEGMLHRLRQENPTKQFYHIAPVATCPNMKKTTLEKILWSLQDLQTPVEVPASVAERARRAIQRMVAVR
ncbi:MAG TPA: quinolinate synthase NadA [Armatimonadota bacterium]|jgi:quinolinate synthase